MRSALPVMTLMVCTMVPLGCSRSAKNDVNRMQGAWNVERLEQDGKRAPDADFLKMVIVKEDKFAFRYFLPRSKTDGDLVHRFSLDVSKNPKVIELISPEDGSVSRGIYELESDSLKICWSRVAQGDLPTDFATSTNRRLLVLKRAQVKR
jgi:uncharacterized protein (TIGR03067 family)